MEKMFITPIEKGRIVRDPESRQPLPDAGAWKPRDSYWTRRLLGGDVVETEPPADAPADAQ